MCNKIETSKYEIETSLNFYSKEIICIHTTDLYNKELTEQLKQFNYHHYLIVKKPRILIKKIKRKRNNCIVFFKFLSKRIIKYKVTINIPNDEIKKIENNKDSFILEGNESGQVIKETAFNCFYETIAKNPLPKKKYLDCELLYVGQAYGTDGERTAIDRLLEHKTLQRILIENQNNQKEDIMIILMNFGTNLINNNNPFNKDFPQFDLDASLKHIEDIQNNPVSDAQKTTIIEASIIRWFEPKYNKEYVENFPKPNQKSYSEGYDKDVNNFLCAIDTSTIGCRLFTKKRKSKEIHVIHLPLYKSDQRKDVFEFIDDE